MEERDGVYWYVSDVSENQRKAGRSAGDAMGFRYLGKNEDGEMRLAAADPPYVTAVCADPCRIIHFSDGTNLAFEPTSVIGAAFQDAMNGFLEAPAPPTPKEPKPDRIDQLSAPVEKRRPVEIGEDGEIAPPDD